MNRLNTGVKTKISILEDEEKWRDYLITVIEGEKEFELVDVFSCGKDAISGIKKRTPEILISDIGVPDINGLSCVKLIKKSLPDIRIMMFTVFEEIDLLFEAIQYGANGFLLKNTPRELLVLELKVLSNGGAPISAGMAKKILCKEQSEKNGATDLNILSKREFQIMNLLALGLNYKEVSDHLQISPHTVRSHIDNIYAKMCVNKRSKAIQFFNSFGNV